MRKIDSNKLNKHVFYRKRVTRKKISLLSKMKLEFRFRVKRRVPDARVQYDYIGEEQVTFLYSAYSRVVAPSGIMVPTLPKAINMILAGGYAVTAGKTEAIAHMSRFKNPYIRDSSPEVVIYLYTSFGGRVDINSLTFDLGMKSGFYEVDLNNEAFWNLYNAGFRPSFTLSSSKHLSKKGVKITVDVKDNWSVTSSTTNAFLLQSLSERPLGSLRETYVDVASNYHIFMNEDDLDILAVRVGMIIPKHISSLRNRHIYFRSNFGEYERVDPETKRIAIKSAPGYFDRYSDQTILGSMGILYTYDSRVELLQKAYKLLSKVKTDLVPVVVTNKKIIQKYMIQKEDLITYQEYEDFIKVERDDTLYAIGNFRIGFFGFLTGSLEQAYTGRGLMLFHNDWASYPNEDDAVVLFNYAHELLQLTRDIEADPGEYVRKYEAETSNAIGVAAADLTYKLFREKFVREFGGKLTPEVREQLIVIGTKIVHIGLYMRQWAGKGTPYPMSAVNSEGNAAIWFNAMSANANLEPRIKDAFDNAGWDGEGAQRRRKHPGDILVEFCGGLLQDGISDIRALAPDLKVIFEQPLVKIDQVNYTPEEGRMNLLQFMEGIRDGKTQYQGCQRAASSKLVWNGVYVLTGGLGHTIPGLAIGQITNIT